MKKLFALSAVLFFLTAGTVFAEGGLTPGCTDPTASNYNPNAQSDDGSCIGGEQNANVQQIQTANAERNARAAQTGQTSGFTALAPIPGLTDTGSAVVDAKSLANFFNNLYKYLIGLAAALAVIMIIWGGLEISTQDSVSKQGAGRERITQAILGLILVLSPVLVFSIINPSILNLSLNLPKLDTASKEPLGVSTTTTPAQLSNADALLRQGVQVFDPFTIPSADQMSILDKKKFLDAQQALCTTKSNGLGIIMPVVGDAGKYVCQTCPPNTSPALFAPGMSPNSPRGTCNPN